MNLNKKIRSRSLVLPLFFLGVAGEGPTAMAQSAGTFSGTGNMITPRYAHTATLLADGKVLIAGGYTSCVIAVPCPGTISAELYDPVAGTFSATGSTATAYTSGAALLPDGRVLLVGSDLTRTRASVELYDPSTGNFRAAGNPTTLKGVYSATPLNDGRVLLIGAVGPPNTMVSGAELYDPAASTSRPVANWPAQLYGPPLTVLADGRVVFYSVDDGTEIYDPADGSFSLNGSLAFFDVAPPATLLLNGKVLLAGGSCCGDFSSSVPGAALLDPATVAFAETGRMAEARYSHSATLLSDGTVLVAGGLGELRPLSHSLATGEIYDPGTGRFSATPDMSGPRYFHRAILLQSGQVLITGGVPASLTGGSLVSVSGTSSAELYTPGAIVPTPMLFPLSGDGRGQGAIWHATTGETASSSSPAVGGEVLSMYTTSLAHGGVIPPQVAIGARLGEVLYFGASGYAAYNQVNFRIPNDVAPGLAISVRLTYLGRPSNEVTISVR